MEYLKALMNLKMAATHRTYSTVQLIKMGKFKTAVTHNLEHLEDIKYQIEAYGDCIDTDKELREIEDSHRRHSRHHWEHWIGKEMPMKYVMEMYADWVANLKLHGMYDMIQYYIQFQSTMDLSMATKINIQKVLVFYSNDWNHTMDEATSMLKRANVWVNDNDN